MLYTAWQTFQVCICRYPCDIAIRGIDWIQCAIISVFQQKLQRSGCVFLWVSRGADERNAFWAEQRIIKSIIGAVFNMRLRAHLSRHRKSYGVIHQLTIKTNIAAGYGDLENDSFFPMVATRLLSRP